MFTKTVVSITAVSMFLAGFAGKALAATNPTGTGQPGTPTVSCGAVTSAGDATQQPNGFLTSGFLDTATAMYAGSSGTPSLLNGSAQAVSQYDIACYQYTTSR